MWPGERFCASFQSLFWQTLSELWQTLYLLGVETCVFLPIGFALNHFEGSRQILLQYKMSALFLRKTWPPSTSMCLLNNSRLDAIQLPHI
jgi:hypothetical protein